MEKRKIRFWKRFLAFSLAFALLMSSNGFTGLADVAASTVMETGEMPLQTSQSQETVESMTEETEDTQTAAPAESPETEPEETNEKQTQTTVPEVQESEEETKETGDGVNAVNLLADTETYVPIQLNSHFVENNVNAGASFNYQIDYSVPAFSTGGEYKSPTIAFSLPEGVTLPQTGVNSSGDPVYGVTGNDVDIVSVHKLGKKEVVTISLKARLEAGAGHTININLKADNFVFKDGDTVRLITNLNGTYPNGDNMASTTTAATTIKADDGWSVEKNCATTGGNPPTVTQNGEEYYLITYTLEVFNQAEATRAVNEQQRSQIDRDGRMNFAENTNNPSDFKYTYKLTDILPKLAEDSTVERPDGYPTNGGAVEVVSVVTGIQGTLEAGKDYKVNAGADGSVESIEFYSMDTLSDAAAANTQYLKDDAGSPIGTTYTVTLKYPKSPYVSLSNETLKRWSLTNTAKLEYTLIDGLNKERSDTATVSLGEKENPDTSYDLKISKYLSVGSEEILLNTSAKAVYSTDAAFTLYKNATGNEVATDINGENPMGERYTDADGWVYFNNLREGTYYLEESKVPNGFASVTANGRIKVTLNKDGTISLNDGAGASNVEVQTKDGISNLKVVNEADTVGGLRFTKTGLKAEGGTAVSLSGVAFSLTNKINATKVYTAVSKTDGTVSFDNIPEGQYTLRELSLPANLSGEYTLDTTAYDVTVNGNTISRPTFDPDWGPGVFKNTSPKGKIRVLKKDHMDTLTLSGAHFNIYGPFESDPGVDYKITTDTPMVSSDVQTGSDGVLLTTPLEIGKYYIIQEIEAPQGYAVDRNLHVVHLTDANAVTEVKVLDTPQVKFRFKKIGQGSQAATGTPFTEPLAGVKFNIYTDVVQPDGSTVRKLVNTGGELITALDSANNAYTEFIKLDFGRTYYYEETYVPDGYAKIDGQVAFVITEQDAGDGSGEYEQTVINTTDQGKIQILKYKEGTTTALEGAEFSVYTNASCTGTPVATLITDNNGSAVSGFLPVSAGTKYYIKETKVPEGYVASLAIINGVNDNGEGEGDGNGISLKPGDTLSIKIYNKETVNAKYKKLKQDTQTGIQEALKGATFGLYRTASCTDPVIQTVRSVDDGTFMFTDLTPDETYYFKEISAPSGYAQDETIRSFVAPSSGTLDNTGISIINKKLGSLKIHKISDLVQNGSPLNLEGATFKLYKAADDAVQANPPVELGKAIGGERVTYTDGIKVWENLAPGKYWLEETKAPANHRLMAPNPLLVTVEIGQTTDKVIQITDDATKGKIQIKKVEAENLDSVIAGAVFDIYDNAACEGTPVTSITTGSDGLAISGWLDEGNYYLKEKSVPAGYELDNQTIIGPLHVAEGSVNTDKVSSPVTNRRTYSYKINKVGTFSLTEGGAVSGSNKYPLEGAVFGVYTDENCSTAYAPMPQIDMSNKASVEVRLPLGNYWIREETTPENYDNSTNTNRVIAITVSADGANEVTVENAPELGKIRLYKYCEKGEALNEANFELYKVVSSIPAGTPDTDWTELPDGTQLLLQKNVSSTDKTGGILQSGTASKLDGSNGTIQGEAVTNEIEPGTYYLREVKAPKDHFYENEWTGPINVVKGQESYVSIIDYEYNHAAGVKTDEDGNGLKDAYIGLFYDQSQALSMSGYIKAAGVDYSSSAYKTVLNSLIGKTGITFNGNAGGNAYAVALHEVVKTNSQGDFIFQNLVVGNTYFVMELAAPDGYTLNTDIFEVKAVQQGDTIVLKKANGDIVDQDILTIPNYRKGYIQVRKMASTYEDGFDESYYNVKGATFKVYAVDSISQMQPEGVEGTDFYINGSNYYTPGTLVASGQTESTGLYTTIALPLGTYVVKETAMPDGVTLNPDVKETYRIVTIGSSDAHVGNYYHLNATYASSENAFKNPVTYGRFALNKTDSAGKGLAAAFDLYKKDIETDTWTKVEGKNFTTAVVSENAVTYISDLLPPGDYKIVETKCDNYTLTEREFTIEAGKVTGKEGPSNVDSSFEPMVIENQLQGSVVIEKMGKFIDPDLLTHLTGVQFVVYKRTLTDQQYNALTQSERQSEFEKDRKANLYAKGTEAASTITTAANGTGSLSGLDAGTYWLYEKSVGNNSDYAPDPVASAFTVEVGKTTSLTGDKAIINTAVKGKLSIRKVDANEPTYGVEGITLTIYKDASCTQSVGTMVTGQDGWAVSGSLEPGFYWVKETGKASGNNYVIDSTKTYPDNAAGYEVKANEMTTAADTVENPLGFEIVLSKTGINDSQMLEGAEFGLYSDSACRDEDLIRKLTVGKGGTVTFDALLKGTYCLKELKSPSGYDLDDTVYTITFDYTLQGNRIVTSCTVAYGTDNPVVITESTVGLGEITTPDGSNVSRANAVYSSNKLDIKIKNEPYGTVKISKRYLWQDAEGTKQTLHAASDVQFEVYAVSGNGVEPDPDTQKSIYTLKTDSEGTAESKPLPEGWYALVETVMPSSEYRKADTVWVQIENMKTNTDYFYAAQETDPDIDKKSIRNLAYGYGRFQVVKYDGYQADGISNTSLSGAEFYLYQETADNPGTIDGYEYLEVGDTVYKLRTVEGVDSFAIGSVNGYESGLLETGQYAIVEKTAPNYRAGDKTYAFAVDKTPITFTISERATVNVNAYNEIGNTIRLTKTGDDYNNNICLTGAKFKLYADAGCGTEAKDLYGSSYGEKMTDAFGICTWSNVAPGTYYIKETGAPSGYSLSKAVVKVVVTGGKKIAGAGAQTLDEYLTTDVDFTNSSNTGRILIKKVSESGSKLDGAKFNIYGKDKDGNYTVLMNTLPLVTGSGENPEGVVLSGTLPAGDASQDYTEYKVVETEAPAGYSLDERLSTIGQIVKVYPIQNPETGTKVEYQTNNVVTFTNKTVESIVGYNDHSLSKQIKLPDQTSGSTYTSDLVFADKSLFESPLNIDFKVGGYAEGTNDLPASSFIVTDDDIQFQYMKNYSDSNTETSDSAFENMPMDEADAYNINSITLHPAGSANPGTNASVKADVYYKTAAKNWTLLQGDVELSGSKSVILTLTPVGESVTGIQIQYKNVPDKFQTDGFEMNVTVNQRDNGSLNGDANPDQLKHEVRRVTNKADISIVDTKKDAEGNIIAGEGNIYNFNSNTVKVNIPTYKTILPTVSLNQTITNMPSAGNVFYTGSKVDYQVVAKNVSSNGADFKKPQISFDISAATRLNQSYMGMNQAFRIYKTVSKPDGSVERIGITPTKTYTETVPAIIGVNPDGSYIYSSTLTTTRYHFEFDDQILTPNESITIDYEAIVKDMIPEGVESIVSPSYLTSNFKIAQTVENPKGTSFAISATDIIVSGDEDNQLGDEAEFLNKDTNVTLASANSIRASKMVSADGSGYEGSGAAISVNPGGDVYYTLTLVNGSDQDVENIRFVDILPFNGDTMVMRGENGEISARNTSIPSGDGYEKMTLQPNGVSLTTGMGSGTIWYYEETGNSWTLSARGSQSREAELPMLYLADGQWTGNWTQSPNHWENVTAVGVEVEFAEGSLLKSGDSYTVTIKMQAPGYTADKIQEYVDKFMINSFAASAVRYGTNTINVYADVVQPDPVSCQMALPTGSIGDYTFKDNNNNGIQDEGDVAFPDVEVTLYQKVKKSVGGQYITETNIIGTKMTDSNGKYLFTDLPCNYLKTGRAEGSTDPNDYVGGEYYTYYLEFHCPDGDYSPTIQYARKDKDDGDDSNINSLGITDEYTLNVLNDSNGLLYGEQNMSIDAGYVIPVSLGNQVWIDKNMNGIIDSDEEGLNGVAVYLYRVDGPEDTVDEGQAWIEKTYTANVDGVDGIYWFRDLPKGYYVVEFDIRDLVKEDGYTYCYAFTNFSQEEFTDNDSNAMPINGDMNERVMRTQVIHLFRDDPTWDAGVFVYNAVGDFCYDDRNYNDYQDLMLPLPGTTVELYEVVNGNRQSRPIQTTVSDENGEYFFDRLPDGDYQLRFVFPDGYTAVQPNVDLPNALTKDTTDSDVIPTVKGNEGFTEVFRLEGGMVDLTRDAGARKLSAIGDYVWFDANKNGIQDEGEEPVPGVKVILQSKTANGDWEFYAETTTDANGKYMFENLKSSPEYDRVYRVVFDFDRSTKVTVTNADNANGVHDNAVDSDALGFYIEGLGYITATIKPGYGETDPTWDAGIIKSSGSVGDYVWYDVNQDGIQDETELGVANVPVVLEMNASGNIMDESAWTVVGETATNHTGYYRFDDLQPGYYRVRFQIPDTYVVTFANRGAADKDSDASRKGDNRWYYSQAFYLEQDGYDMTWDAGIYLKSDQKITTVFNRIFRTIATGDPTSLILLFILVLLSGGTIIYIVRKRYRRANKD